MELVPMTDTPAIQKFLKLVQTSTNARSKDIRLDAKDATVLAAEIGVVLAKLATALSKNVDLSASIDLNINGGKF